MLGSSIDISAYAQRSCSNGMVLVLWRRQAIAKTASNKGL